MTKFVFKRSKEVSGLSDVIIETELTEEQLQFIEQIHKLEKDLIQEMARGSGYIREFYVHHRCPYGYMLSVSFKDIRESIEKTKQFIDSNLAKIERQSPQSVETILQIHALVSEFLAS